MWRKTLTAERRGEVVFYGKHAKPVISEGEIQSYYQAHMEQYKSAEQVQTRHILIMVPQGSDAKADAAAKAKAAVRPCGDDDKTQAHDLNGEGPTEALSPCAKSGAAARHATSAPKASLLVIFVLIAISHLGTSSRSTGSFRTSHLTPQPAFWH